MYFSKKEWTLDHFEKSNLTGLNLYPQLIHGDLKRRNNYRARAASKVRKDFLSASYFSYFYLW